MSSGMSSTMESSLSDTVNGCKIHKAEIQWNAYIQSEQSSYNEVVMVGEPSSTRFADSDTSLRHRDIIGTSMGLQPSQLGNPFEVDLLLFDSTPLSNARAEQCHGCSQRDIHNLTDSHDFTRVQDWDDSLQIADVVSSSSVPVSEDVSVASSEQHQLPHGYCRPSDFLEAEVQGITSIQHHATDELYDIGLSHFNTQYTNSTDQSDLRVWHEQDELSLSNIRTDLDLDSSQELTPTTVATTRRSIRKPRTRSVRTVKASASVRHTLEDWERIKPIFARYYLQMKKELNEVIRILAHDHNFHATKKMYKTRISSWGFFRNNAKAQKHYVDDYVVALGEEGFDAWRTKQALFDLLHFCSRSGLELRSVLPADVRTVALDYLREMVQPLEIMTSNSNTNNYVSEVEEISPEAFQKLVEPQRPIKREPLIDTGVKANHRMERQGPLDLSDDVEEITPTAFYRHQATIKSQRS